MPKKQDERAFRLRFGHTTTRRYAPTLKQAVVDARYWLGFGQTQVCIDRLKLFGYKQVRCLTRRRRARR